MSENRKFQLNVKFGGGYEAPLLNIEGDNQQEFQENVKFAADNAAAIVQAATTFLAAYNVAKPQDPPPAPAPAPQAAPAQQGGWNTSAATPPPAFAQQTQQQYAQAATQAPQQGSDEGLIPPQFCAHGAMKLNRAKPGSGKNWVAYMCPTPKGTPGQCSPIDAKTGKSWG